MNTPICSMMMLLVVTILTACTNVGQPTAQATNTVTATTLLQTEAPTPTQVPTIAPPGTPISISTLTGKIAYSNEGDIYVMNLADRDVTRLTTGPAEDFDPAWSPDGTRIVFRSHRDDNEEVYVMNADGSDQRNVSNSSGGDYSPAWSPNGKWIAFMSDRGGNANVWVMGPDGSALRQVTDLAGISEYPTWSPDSRRIAFHCTFGDVLPGGTGDFEICVVNTNGTDLTQLTDTPGENKLPAWSPDGVKIAFQSNRNGWPTLPEYVPPGYDPERFGDYEIYMMNVDGSEQINLTHHPKEDDTFSAWSGDGYLIFSRYGCLIVMTSDGSSMVQISRGLCTGKDSGQFPDWFQPTG